MKVFKADRRGTPSCVLFVHAVERNCFMSRLKRRTHVTCVHIALHTQMVKRLLIHATKREKRWPHGRAYPFEWRWTEYHLRRVPLKDVRPVSGKVRAYRNKVQCYTDVVFTKTNCIQTAKTTARTLRAEAEITPHLVSDPKGRVDLRVHVPWLGHKSLYSRLVAFHFWPPGFTWKVFHKKAARKKGYCWVVDHLKPPHEFRVGDKWSRLVLANYLEIVSQQENVRRERAHGMRVG